MGKMFYSADEAAAKLSVTADKLKELVEQSKLREFRDGNKTMFKVDQVDRLAGDMKVGTGTGSGVIDLAPSDTSGIGLAGESHAGKPAGDTRQGTAAGKTAGTPDARGMRVFDEHEVKATDASAQTQISSPIYDAISPSGLDSVGSGSGLLDLTRESDNTSLGAELLDEIYPGEGGASQAGIGSSSGVFDSSGRTSAGGAMATGAGSPALGAESPAAMSGQVTYAPVVEAADPTAGMFGGLALAAVLAMVLVFIITTAGVAGFSPSWLGMLAKNIWLFTGLLAVVTLLFGFVGFFAGKAATR